MLIEFEMISIKFEISHPYCIQCKFITHEMNYKTNFLKVKKLFDFENTIFKFKLLNFVISIYLFKKFVLRG